MKLSRRNRNHQLPANAGDTGIVQREQFPAVPTKPTKALVAALVTLAGLVGIQLTTGTAQAIVMVVQLVAVAYGVWRTRNGTAKHRGRDTGTWYFG